MQNDASSKLASVKQLSTDQQTVLTELLVKTKEKLKDNESYIFCLNGDAGTGKSVVLTEFFKQIQYESRKDNHSVFYQTNNYLTVNHAEMIKTYQDIARNYQFLYQKDIQKPTPLINKLTKEKRKADVIVIDEGHLLLTQPDRYNKFNQNNQLEELIKRSKILIVVFDEHQFLKTKSFWSAKIFKSIVERQPHQFVTLKDQYRLKAPQSVIDWIDNLAKKRILTPLPKTKKYDLRLYSDLSKMYDDLKEKNENYGLSRLISTADYPYKMDNQLHYVTEPGFQLPWDHDIDPHIPWAQRPETINEVGSIYTIQGFDLNYAGVILGPGIDYDDKNDRVIVNPSFYQDQEAFKRRSDNQNLMQIKQQIMLNAVNVLLKRGVYGLYIYASSPRLKEALDRLKH